jgi:hypothetical protein
VNGIKKIISNYLELAVPMGKRVLLDAPTVLKGSWVKSGASLLLVGTGDPTLPLCCW